MATQVPSLAQFNTDFPIAKVIRWLVIILALLWLVSSTVIFIPPGHVGVRYDRVRGVQQTTLKEGIGFAIPFFQRIILFDTRLQEYTMSAQPDEGALLRDDTLDAPTSDGQQVNVEATILYRIEPDKAPQIVQTIGTDYVDKLIRPFTRSQIRMIISRYSAPAIYSEKREEAEKVMTTELAELLVPKNIIVDKVLLRAVYFSDEYSHAIEAKVIAEQRIKQAEFEVQEATQRAEAKIAEAKGLAEAQALQKATLTQEFLQLEAIKKWNGQLPQVAGESAPLINIPLR